MRLIKKIDQKINRIFYFYTQNESRFSAYNAFYCNGHKSIYGQYFNNMFIGVWKHWCEDESMSFVDTRHGFDRNGIKNDFNYKK